MKEVCATRDLLLLQMPVQLCGVCSEHALSSLTLIKECMKEKIQIPIMKEKSNSNHVILVPYSHRISKTWRPVVIPNNHRGRL